MAGISKGYRGGGGARHGRLDRLDGRLADVQLSQQPPPAERTCCHKDFLSIASSLELLGLGLVPNETFRPAAYFMPRLEFVQHQFLNFPGFPLSQRKTSRRNW